MSAGSISDASMKYFEEKHIQALLDEAMRDVLMAMPDDPLRFLEEALQRRTPLRLIVSGLPACGKGKQCERLVERYGLRHISAGDILRRAAMDESTPDSVKELIAGHIREGSLVPDEVIMGIVEKEVREAERAGVGWVLDGFPRTRAQAIYLQTAGISPQRFLMLDVPEEVCAKRFLCLQASVQDSALKPDGAPSALQARLDYFKTRKAELLDCYRPFFVRIDGNRSVEEVFAEICAQCDAIEAAK